MFLSSSEADHVFGHFIFLLSIKYAHKLLLGDRGTMGGGPASRDVSKSWPVSDGEPHSLREESGQ